ncbi:MAG TPA: hypothetical protein VFD00_05900 [Thermoclostridium sp.]|nr:hypothetical protein [Thermoclostridium sp.]
MISVAGDSGAFVDDSGNASKAILLLRRDNERPVRLRPLTQSLAQLKALYKSLCFCHQGNKPPEAGPGLLGRAANVVCDQPA